MTNDFRRWGSSLYPRAAYNIPGLGVAMKLASPRQNLEELLAIDADVRTYVLFVAAFGEEGRCKLHHRH